MSNGGVGEPTPDHPPRFLDGKHPHQPSISFADVVVFGLATAAAHYATPRTSMLIHFGVGGVAVGMWRSLNAVKRNGAQEVHNDQHSNVAPRKGPPRP